MNVLIVSSELYPFAKTGGLADVITSLSQTLRVQGLDAQILIPGYAEIISKLRPLETHRYQISNYRGFRKTDLLRTVLPGVAAPVWVVDCPEVYNVGGGIYSQGSPHCERLNFLKFGILSWAAGFMANAGHLPWQPDIVHLNDWHTALAPAFSKRNTGPPPPMLMTIHNLAFQGRFPLGFLDLLDLEPEDLGASFNLANGEFSFLELGLRQCDAITTVSPTYAKEILTDEFGFGLQTLLCERQNVLTGVLNGVDYDVWNPDEDKHLKTAVLHDFSSSKNRFKTKIQARLGLPAREDVCLLSFTSRFTEQKMLDRVFDILPEFSGQKVQFIAHGQGDSALERRARALARDFPEMISVQIGYDEALEHQIHAGSDVCLAPSRFEPCGLNPLYAMRYGSVPLVRRTGGLADTVINVSDATLADQTANGFVFDRVDAASLKSELHRALSYFEDQQIWEMIRRSAMHRNFGWNSAARKYVEIYEQLLQKAGKARRTQVQVFTGHRHAPFSGPMAPPASWPSDLYPDRRPGVKRTASG